MKMKLLIGFGVGLALMLPSLAQNFGFFKAESPVPALTAVPMEHSVVNVVAQVGATSTAKSGMPARGMSMQQVESDYGAPADRRTPVGDPPITRWEYLTFIVYFEYRHVIHAVEKR